MVYFLNRVSKLLLQLKVCFLTPLTRENEAHIPDELLHRLPIALGVQQTKIQTIGVWRT